jgi:hypothetical protein
MTEYEDIAFVDFDDDSDDENVIMHDNTTKPLSKYDMTKMAYQYDKRTLEYYRVIRERRSNPFFPDMCFDQSDDVFQYPFRWNAYDGNIIDVDPYGPLCFDPEELSQYFYSKRLNMLWHNETDTSSGVYGGYYGDAVGSGLNIKVEGRGEYKERFLFRLPILDCYLPTTHHNSVVTMGPLLTLDMLEEIDTLNGVSYDRDAPLLKKVSKRKGKSSLVHMYKLYLQALSVNPDLSEYITDKDLKRLNGEKLKQLRDKANRYAVDILKSM